MRADHPTGLSGRDTTPHPLLLPIIVVTCLAAVELTAISLAGAAKPKDHDDPALLDAADYLRTRDLSAARQLLAPLCPGDLDDAVRGTKKGKMPCRLIVIAETEARGTRSPDKLSLLYWGIADDARKSEQFVLAKALYAVAIDRYPSDPENWYWLGIVERDLGRFVESRQALARALELKPDHRDALYWTATDLMDEGKYAESAELLDRLLASDPKDGRAWYRRGELLSRQGRCPEATIHFEKARALGVDPRKIKGQIENCESAGN